MNDWLSEIEERKFGNSDIKRMARVLRELAMFYSPSPTEYEILSDDAKALIDTSRN